MQIQYNMRSYFNLRSKGDISQLNILDGNRLKSGKEKNYKVKNGMFRSIGKQSRESRESVEKEYFMPGMKG